MILKSFLKLTHTNVNVHIFYEDNTADRWIIKGTAEEIKRMHTYRWFLKNKKIEKINVHYDGIHLTIKENNKKC